MNNAENELKILLKKYNLTGIIYAETDGRNVVRVGDLESLPHTGLVQILFGGKDEITNLHDSVHLKTIPTGWGQGEVFCWVDVTRNKKIFGVFGTVKKENIVENFKQSKIFCAEIKTVLENEASDR